MASPVGKMKKLSEITNTPRSRKLVVEEPEGCVQTPDKEIIDLNLDVSDDSDSLFKGLELDIDDLVFK